MARDRATTPGRSGEASRQRTRAEPGTIQLRLTDAGGWRRLMKTTSIVYRPMADPSSFHRTSKGSFSGAKDQPLRGEASAGPGSHAALSRAFHPGGVRSPRNRRSERGDIVRTRRTSIGHRAALALAAAVAAIAVA